MRNRLLIVDDEQDLLNNMGRYLSSFENEFEVLTASSGEEALVALTATEVDTLLTDIRLPGIDGIELLQKALEDFPHIKAIVMTAFGSQEIRRRSMDSGALRFMEKPVDLVQLRDVLLQMGNRDEGWSGSLGGLDLFDFTQLMSLGTKDKVIHVSSTEGDGILVFDRGQLIHASCGQETGPAAFSRMARWKGGHFEEIHTEKSFQRNITSSTTHLMMETVRIQDEEASAQSGKPEDHGDLQEKSMEITGDDTPGFPQRMEGFTMSSLKEHLQPIADVSGFLGVAVFTEGGELLEEICPGKIDTHSIGIYSNNVLLNAQKATDDMGVGRGNYVTIDAPKAKILVRCYNESTDFAASAEGKVHFHLVVILEADGNTGMAKLMLEKAVQGIAEFMH